MQQERNYEKADVQAGTSDRGNTVRVWWTHSEVIDGQWGDAGRVTGELSDVAELLHIPQDAGKVTRSTYDQVVDLGRGQARHPIRVTI